MKRVTVRYNLETGERKYEVDGKEISASELTAKQKMHIKFKSADSVYTARGHEVKEYWV